jgi:hypothetical protein
MQEPPLMHASYAMAMPSLNAAASIIKKANAWVIPKQNRDFTELQPHHRKDTTISPSWWHSVVDVEGYKNLSWGMGASHWPNPGLNTAAPTISWATSHLLNELPGTPSNHWKWGKTNYFALRTYNRSKSRECRTGITKVANNEGNTSINKAHYIVDI